MRLNKFLASRGVDARRKCDDLIQKGRVKINNRTVLEPGFQVEMGRDLVSVDGKVIETTVRLVYILLYKPAGYVVTAKDPQNRPTVFDIIEGIGQRIFAVGRLDLDVEGALLLTNDGEVGHRLIHPRYEIEKIYHVLVMGKPSQKTLRAVSEGLHLNDGPTAPAEVVILKGDGETTLLELKIHEGRKRQIKRMWSSVGHSVVKLIRTVFAGLTIDGLQPGEWRYLSKDEVNQLKEMVGLSREKQQKT